jgi:prophage maintenance system killer protein
MIETSEIEQSFASTDAEQEKRREDASQLIEGIIGHHKEFFAEPANRLEFFKTQTADDFLRIAKYVNAKLRGEKPHQLRHDKNEVGSFLEMMHTPSIEDKPEAFKNGYRAIQDYLAESDDPIEKKIEGIAAASEALVLWVHPFNDGNHRTAWFLGKFIEEGGTDIEGLVKETTSGAERGRVYYDKIPTKETILEYLATEDVGLSDGVKASLLKRAENMPSDVEAMYQNIKLILENDTVRQNTHLREKELAY